MPEKIQLKHFQRLHSQRGDVQSRFVVGHSMILHQIRYLHYYVSEPSHHEKRGFCGIASLIGADHEGCQTLFRMAFSTAPHQESLLRRHAKGPDSYF